MAQARWRTRSTSRTPEMAATVLTDRVTSGPLIWVVASTPSTTTATSSTWMWLVRATSTMASVSARSTPRAMTAKATDRYIAPVSKYSNPNRSASRRATVDFPDPAGPSMAMTLTSLIL